jgi:hypothetical protein
MDAVRDIILSAGTKHDVPLGHLTGNFNLTLK